jgi:hypothetical protein
MQTCNKIYYSTVRWRLNMFRAAYRSSSGALTVFAASDLHTYLVTGCSQVWVETASLLFIFSFISLVYFSFFFHSFIHSFIHLFIHSFIHLFFLSFIHSFIHPFFLSFIHLFSLSFPINSSFIFPTLIFLSLISLSPINRI